MADTKTSKTKNGDTVTAKKGGVISNGEGGFFEEGDKFEASKDTAASLKAKGYI